MLKCDFCGAETERVVRVALDSDYDMEIVNQHGDAVHFDEGLRQRSGHGSDARAFPGSQQQCFGHKNRNIANG